MNTLYRFYGRILTVKSQSTVTNITKYAMLRADGDFQKKKALFERRVIKMLLLTLITPYSDCVLEKHGLGDHNNNGDRFIVPSSAIHG